MRARLDKLVSARGVDDLVARCSDVTACNKPLLSNTASQQVDTAVHADHGGAIVVVTLAADLDHPSRSSTTMPVKLLLQPTACLKNALLSTLCRTYDRNTPHRLFRLSLGSGDQKIRR
jgi:hypothetical protein